LSFGSKNRGALQHGAGREALQQAAGRTATAAARNGRTRRADGFGASRVDARKPRKNPEKNVCAAIAADAGGDRRSARAGVSPSSPARATRAGLQT